ncbi:MAG: quinolinate synthase NadA [Kiritimatiellia bacterium]|jgi:quinolinate synthase
MNTVDEIQVWKRKRNAVLLAHNYTLPEVQDIADFVGDSLELARQAAELRAPVIVFCGVRFMAETAKILSPASIVLHPVPDAGCPMADMADADAVKAARAAHRDALVVAYVNTTAATKTAVDVCCTSGNVEQVISSLPRDKEILFLPDANLGSNVARKLDRPMRLWDGCCPIHDRITPGHLRAAREAHPGALVLVHPECRPETVAEADASLSTGGMLQFARTSPATDFIIGTEIGILHRLRKENPGKRFFPLSPGPVCADMKKIHLEDVLQVLRTLSPRIELDEETLRLARQPIDRMLAL